LWTEGRPGADGLCDQLLLGDQPGQAILLVGPHRAAHGDDAGVSAPVRERIALVDLDAIERRSPSQELVLEGRGRLAGDVLEDEERGHARQPRAALWRAIDGASTDGGGVRA
jgi:hypothetical protein